MAGKRGEEGAIGFCCTATPLQELVFVAGRLELALACEFPRQVLQLLPLVRFFVFVREAAPK
eukprot:247382-Alexandrium_andersonii.AAC.1